MEMSTFTCSSCRVVFTDGELQRLHYKSDWHRYNLKRKVAELPPVTAEEFQRRVLQQRGNEQQCGKSSRCIICHKSFSNTNAFENHLQSKKHKDQEKRRDDKNHDTAVISSGEKTKMDANHEVDFDFEVQSEVDSDVEEVDSDEWENDTENPIDKNDCLFCSHHSKSLLKNVKHMSVAHSFFVPDIEYCSDLRGLLSYLGEKINKGFMCLWCNEKGRTFYSADAARHHMVDKGHCKMIHEGLTLAEYADYYDYSKSYPDADNKDVDVEEEIEIEELEDNDYQLVLPSGIVVGHRSLMKYYKQHLDPNRTVHHNYKKLHKVLAHYKAIGWSGTQQEAVSRTARDVHYMKRMQAKLSTKLSTKANKLQKHFRRQVAF